MPSANLKSLITIPFNPNDDNVFRTFQRIVSTLLPGATSIRGIPQVDENGNHVFAIEEICDVENNAIWIRPNHEHGQLEELVFLWESRIYEWYALSHLHPIPDLAPAK